MTPSLQLSTSNQINLFLLSYLLNTPPNKEALRHSGGDNLLCTSPTVTLYLEVELSSDRRPGTEQNTSFMLTVTPPISPSLPSMREPMFLGGMGTEIGNQRHEHADTDRITLCDVFRPRALRGRPRPNEAPTRRAFTVI